MFSAGRDLELRLLYSTGGNNSGTRRARLTRSMESCALGDGRITER